MEVVIEDTVQIRAQHIKRYHAAKTKEIVELSLKAYDRYLEHEKIDEIELIARLRNSPDAETYFFLDGMVQYWNEQNRSPKTIRTYFTFIRAYFRQCRLRTTVEDVREYVRFPRLAKELRQPLIIEQIRGLLEYCGAQQKAFFLVLVSSGMRASEALVLMVGDIDTRTRSVRIRASTTKTRQERRVFISKEALQYLEPYMREKAPTDRIFSFSLKNIELYMGWLRRKTKLLTKYDNGINYHVNIHAFRAFFHTKATLLHGVEYAHAMLGHGSYLQQYFRLTEEEKQRKYEQLEPYVSIYQDSIIRAENQTLKEKVESIDEMRRRIVEYEDRLKRLEVMRK